MKTHATAIALAAAFAATASADIISLTPSDVHGEDTNTSMFDNGDVTITTTYNGAPATFNASANFLGSDGGPSGPNGFNDEDTDATNGNSELLILDFEANAGLASLSWSFSRAVVAISGFTADPFASFTGQTDDGGGNFLTSSYDDVTGTLTFELPFGISFNANVGTLVLDAAASAGQTLTVTVTDPNQAGAQLAVTGLSYDNMVPTPGAVAVLGLGGLAAARRRR